MRIPKVNLGVNTKGASHLISEAKQALKADAFLKSATKGKKGAKNGRKAAKGGCGGGCEGGCGGGCLD